MTNKEVADILERVGQVLEIRGENPFKARAYYSAARTIENLGEDINRTVSEGALSDIPGFGEALTKKVTELVTTGRMGYLDEIMEPLPEGILTLLKIPDVGPKKVRVFYDSLGIGSIDELEEAASDGRLAKLAGMGEKSQAGILDGIRLYRRYQGRRLLSDALGPAEHVLREIKKIAGVKRASLAGSIRRRLETIGDIDILAASDDAPGVVRAFTELDGVERVPAAGDTKGTVIFAPGIQIDLRVVEDRSYAAARHYFTGSKEHNIHMRRLAVEHGWKLNEYGLFDGDTMLPARDEEALFAHFVMEAIPPELRENTGEIEAALRGKLPDLVETKNVRGLVHIHSSWSDGKMSLQELGRQIKRRGFTYFVLSDHSKAVTIANGLTESRVRRQWEEVARVQEHLSRFRIFRSIEVDIMRDGSLDYDDSLLSQFDCSIAAVHSGFAMSSQEMTARIIKAVSNPYVDILAHPTGRLLLQREPYAVDIEAVLQACADNDVAVEISAHPLRLDLDWRYVKAAKDIGAKFVVSLDAHDPEDLDYLAFGVGVARKGWLEKADVLNCLTAQQFAKRLSDRRRGL
ncbi:MAG: DNA polymerase/3'-5' exonuclease PolX [Planctomycetes bacterium]|nr:DNA polymerase/3'-5' exonuclease PolX [Planctomycetota bacterium]